MEIELSNIGVEFIFDVNFSGTEKVNFYRKLYGYRSYSYYGKYTYIKEGFLSNINYIKPTKSTIIVSVQDSEKLKNFLKKYKVVFDEKIVFLNEKDAKKLGLSYPSMWNKIYEKIKEKPNTVFYIGF